MNESPSHGFRWQQQNIAPLQARLDGIVGMADLVDEQLADAIVMAESAVAPPPAAPSPGSTPSPELEALHRANDQAMVDAAERVRLAQDALAEAMSTMYVYGPGTPEFDAIDAQLPALKRNLVQALAEAGQIPDFHQVDPSSVGVGPGGVNFSYRLPDGRTATVTSTRLKDGSVELWDNGAQAVHTYRDGRFVGTRYLDEGRAVATAEPLFSAVTAPLGLGPAIKGGQAAFHGLRSLFTREAVEVMAGTSADDVLVRGSEIVAARGQTAADNLAANAAEVLRESPPSTVTGPGMEVLPAVPEGATGTLAANGKGMIYEIPPGTPGLDPRVIEVRVMDPNLTGKHKYPDGYITYHNANGQTVNPVTGRTIPPHDPYWHIPLS